MARSPHDRVFLSAHWRSLVMLNWEVDPQLLQPHLPYGTELDFFEGKVYGSIVGFLFQKTRLLGLPIPGHRNFEELNLRYYVLRREPDELRHGVAFISELVPKRAIALVARRCYNENYLVVPMHHEVGRDTDSIRARYDWKLGQQENHVAATGTGAPHELMEGTFEHFIAEHYWGYSAQKDGSTLEYRVRHPSWAVWQADEATLCCDGARLYGTPLGAILSRKPDTAFIADGSEVTVSFPRRIGPGSDARR